MRWRVIELLAVILLAWLISRAQQGTIALRVLKVDKEGNFSAVPVRPPTVIFSSGASRVSEHELLLCPKERVETRQFADHIEHMVILYCGEGKAITLQGVFFE